jgi:hypothetical protein
MESCREILTRAEEKSEQSGSQFGGFAPSVEWHSLYYSGRRELAGVTEEI